MNRDTSVIRATALIAVGTANAEQSSVPKPVGSGVLVSQHHVITALHNLDDLNDSRYRFLVCFPALPGRPCTDIRPEDVVQYPDLDVAVITLGEELPALPNPLRPSHGTRIPNKADVFGFPLKLGIHGMWCSLAAPHLLPSGRVQWSWAGRVGAQRGHSGGPVVHKKYPTLLGILVQGAGTLGFDTMVPVRRIAECWREFRLPWLYFGSQGQVDHKPAMGPFVGRLKALAKVRNWIEAPDSPSEVLAITGQPGAGKSAVLAEAAFTAERLLPGSGLVFDAHSATSAQLLEAVAELMDLSSQRPEDIVQEALDTERDGPIVVMVDALDEAAKGHRRTIAQTLVQLAQVSSFRVIVATRRLAVDTHLDPEGFLKMLGVKSPAAGNLIDLDTDAYFDGQALADYTRELLSQEEGAFWEPDQRNRVAEEVVARAGRNFLVAELAANSLSRLVGTVDLKQTSEPSARVPDSVEEAVSKYLDGLEQAHKDLLTALAFARGPGLTDSLWLGFAQALGFDVKERDLIDLREAGAAANLVESESDKSQRVTRLFHQALVDYLLKQDRTSNEKRVFDFILNGVRNSGGWGRADEYARTYAAEHALFAGALRETLEDPAFVVHSDLDRLVASINHLLPGERQTMAVVVLRAAGRAASLKPRARADLFALTAAHLGIPSLRDTLMKEAGGGLKPIWAHSLGQPHQELIAHAGEVLDLKLGRLGGRDIVASGHARGSVLAWDENGDPIFAPLRAHKGAVLSVAVGSLGGRDILAEGGDDGSVSLWDANGERIGEPLSTDAGPVQDVAIGRLGQEVIAVAGSDHSVRVWRWDREPLFTVWHHDLVQAVAFGQLGELDVLVSGGNDHAVRVWDAHGNTVLGPLHHPGGEVHAVAIGKIDGYDVIVAGGQDGVVRVWNSDGHEIAQLEGHTGWVQSISVGRIGENEVIVSGSVDTTVRIWTSKWEQFCPPLYGHDKDITAVALGKLGAKSVVVSASRDETVRIWDPLAGPTGDSEHPEHPVVGHTGAVHSVTVGDFQDTRDVIVSAGFDSSVRVWNERGEPLKVSLMGPRWGINATAVGRLGEDPVIVAGGFDNSVQAWSTAGEHSWRIEYAHMASVNGIAVGKFDDRDVVVSCSDDGTVKLWDMDGGNIGYPWWDGGARIFAVALGMLRDQQVVATGSEDGVLRIWNSGGKVRLRTKAHPGPVKAVALGRLGGRDVIVSAGARTVCLWSDDGSPLRVMWGHTADINAVAVGSFQGQDVIVSTGRDCTVRVWDESGQPVGQPFPLLEEAQGTAVHPAGILVATGPALTLLS